MADARLFPLVFGALAAGGASAGSGFAVRTQSAVALGMAQAGVSTGVGGIATMVHNPATLATTSGRLVETSVGIVALDGAFRDITAQNVLGDPIGGGNGSEDVLPGVLPNLFVAADLTSAIRAGLAITPLYGLATYHPDDWTGRYHALDSELASVTVQPTLSWQATPWLAVGAGFQIQYMRTRSTAAIDFGTIDAASGGFFGGVPGADDGKLEATLDGFGYGFSVGALLMPAPGTRIGVGFRAPVDQSLDGDADFSLGGPVGAGLAAATGGFANTGVSSDVALPAGVFVGAQQALGGGVTLYADLHWSGWSRIEALTLAFDNPAQPDAVTTLPWQNSIYAAVGASWAVDERLTLRGGAAFDQGPGRDGGAAVAIPDGDSLYTTAGLSYRLTDRMVLDAMLGAVFTEDVTVTARASDPAGTFRGDFRGVNADGRSYFASLGFRLGF